MPPQLVALTEGPNILLDKPILLLGRHQECDIQLGSRKVSRRHCCVAQVNDYLVVRDLGSTNGIRINGVRVVEGSLRPGDELTVGNQRYKVQWNANPHDPVASQLGAPQVRARVQLPAALPPEDAHLESCDIPVPLADPMPFADPVPPVSEAPAAVPPAPPASEAPAALPPAPPAQFLPAVEAPSLIVPDDLQLAPLREEKQIEPPAGSDQSPDH